MNTVWQIGWKEERGGEMRLTEMPSLRKTALWLLRNLKRCVVVVVTRIEE